MNSRYGQIRIPAKMKKPTADCITSKLQLVDLSLKGPVLHVLNSYQKEKGNKTLVNNLCDTADRGKAKVVIFDDVPSP